ncbi:MAG: AsmA-like C-terminal region-containing protein [bacterium]|nr:AsmA-like C-terminal region-containing protein [bacterium]
MSKFFNKYLFIIGGILVVWLAVLPAIVPTVLVTLCKNLSVNTDYKIELQNPKFHTYILPYVKLSADKLAVQSKKEQFHFGVTKFDIKVRILPLLSGKVHISKVKIASLNLMSNLKDFNTLDKDFFIDVSKSGIICDLVKVSSYSMNFISPTVTSSVKYDGKDFLFENKNRFVRVKADSYLNTEKTTSKIYLNLFLPKNNDINKTLLDINITNLNLEPLAEYFKEFIPEKVTKVVGQIDIKADSGELITELKKIRIYMKDNAQSMIFPDKTDIKSSFNISNSGINIKYANFIAKDLHFSISGNINAIWGKVKPTFDLNIVVNKSRIENFIKMLPPFVTEEFNTANIKKYKLYGNILANIVINGSLPEPNLAGNVYIDDAVLIKPVPNTTKGATIKLSFLGKHVRFEAYVPAGDGENVTVKGIQEIYNVKYSEMTIKSTPNVNLANAEAVVEPLHEILNFKVGPLPLLDVKGIGNIDISFKGNRQNPHIIGLLNFNNATVNFKDFPDLLVKEANAVLTFEDQNTIFKTIKAKLNGSDFEINGTSDLSGKFNYKVSSKNQMLKNVLQSISTSKIPSKIKTQLSQIFIIQGMFDFDINIYGNMNDINNIKFNENVFLKGEINLQDGNIIFNGTNIKDANGKINLSSDNLLANINAVVDSSPLICCIKIKNNIADIILDVPKFNPNFLIKQLKSRKEQILPNIYLNVKYNGNIDQIDFEKIRLKAKPLYSSNDKSFINCQSGEFILDKGKLNVKNLTSELQGSKTKLSANFRVDNVFSKSPSVNGIFNFNSQNLSDLNNLLNRNILPINVQKYVKDYEFTSGVVNFNGKIVNNKLTTSSDLNDILLKYLPLELPVKILNGKLSVKNNNIFLEKINVIADEMPILIDGNLKNIIKIPMFDIYINSKPKQEFIEKYINRNRIYPLKIKGDMVYTAKVAGTKDNFNIKTKADLSKGGSLYYYGATIGDVENSIILNADMTINNKLFKIKEFAYDKLIESQSGKHTRINMLIVSGSIEQRSKDFLFDNLHIKTSNPTDARIFNIIFGKPNIKQGQFISDLKINGTLSNPRILGDFHIFETDIPFLDMAVKNIEILFKNKTINVATKGEVIGNEISIFAILKNNFTKPYRVEKAILYTKNLNLNQVIDKLKVVEADNAVKDDSINEFDIKSFIVDDMKLKADKILLRNIHATNFESNMKLTSNSVFEMKNFVFNIANGSLQGKYRYDFKNSKMNFTLYADRIDANDITWALFDLKNQIYGDMTGNVNLSCSGKNFEKCMSTLNGNAKFNVKGGRMPKLGSLECLLRAGNLVKSGLTNLSINSILDIMTPQKTGEFSDIYGNIIINDGIADNIEIATQGKNMSLFIGGIYNFASAYAEMEVFGMISGKFSSLLGPIGNISVNTLFNLIPGVDLSKNSSILDNINKIPGIELSNKTYRKFIAEIKGNINGDDYVKSFKWIN